MIRKTLTILSLIGLLLSVGLWGVSYWNLVVSFTRPTKYSHFTLTQGYLKFEHLTFYRDPRKTENYVYVGGFSGLETVWMLPYYYRSGLPQSPDLHVYIPVNLFALAFLILTGYLLAPFHRRRKRKKLGLCIKCGYDLRGSKERCPECGTGFSK